MIYNPYAKKRPRPANWTTASSSSRSPSSALALSGSNHPSPVLTSVSNSHVVNDNSNNQRIFPQNQSMSHGAVQHSFTRSVHTTFHSNVPSSEQSNAYHNNASSTANAATLCRLQQQQRTLSNPYAKQQQQPKQRPVAIPRSNSTENETTTKPIHTVSSSYGGSSSQQHSSPTNNAHTKQAAQPYPYAGFRSNHGVSPSMGGNERSGAFGSASKIVVSRHTNCTDSNRLSSFATTQTPNTAGKTISTSVPKGMASMRPASWKTPEPAPPMVGNHSSCGYGGLPLPTALSTASSSTTTNDDPNDRLPPELSYGPEETKPVQDEYRMALIKNAKLSSPLQNGWTLFPHQKKAIIRGLTMRRMILALDMGLGKTLIGAVWSMAFWETFGRDKLKIFVVCPVSLKEEWRRTARDKVGLVVEDDDEKKTTKKKTKTKRAKTSCKNDDNDKDGCLGMSICSWAKVPKLVDASIPHFVVCCDEAHAMQSTQAQRTKDVLKLVRDKRCVGVLLLTGTPMKNGKPGNLFPLLKAVRHPLGRHQKAYEAHFCNGTMKNFGRGPQWDASGASNLDQLKRKVASNLLHMTKEQCLKALPPMTKIFHDVPVSSRFQVQYEQSIKFLATVQANSNNINAKDEAVLGAVQRLRVVCAHAKIEATVEMARRILDKEPAVVIFSYFAQVAKTVHSKLSASGWPCSLLTGETPQNKRQELVDRFQNGLSSVFVCTFGAGGVGLTLTAASTILLLDRPWTPGETRQAEDRIRRIGQTKECTSYWIRSFDLDKQIDAIVESKTQTTNAVLDRNSNTAGQGSYSKKISIQQLVHKFVLAESRKQLKC